MSHFGFNGGAADISTLLAIDGSTAGTGIQELLGLNFTDAAELTIAVGVITRTQTYHRVDTEADAATDDLNTINGGAEGDIVIIRPENNARTVVIKHGVGNINCVGNIDITLDDGHDFSMLVFDGTNWMASDFSSTSGGVTDHGALTGNADDDHTQYILVDSTRAATGNQEFLGLNLTNATELTIAVGVITKTQSYHRVDTEADAASDDLATINGGAEGDIIVLRAENAARIIVIKHASGNIRCVGDADITLDDAYDFSILLFDGTNWMAAVLSDANTGVTDHGALTGLTDDDHTQYILVDSSRAGTGDQEFAGLNFTDPTELTISAGVITKTQSTHKVDTEADASTDDLDTISGGVEGDILILYAESGVRDIVIKQGTGNISVFGQGDITLAGTDDWCLLVFHETGWLAANLSSDHGAMFGLSDDDHTQYILVDGSRDGTGIQQFLGVKFPAATELTIATGAITKTASLHRIDTESNAATDDLDTINGGSNGDVLIIHPDIDSRTIVVKHNTGNIKCVGDADITLDDAHDYCILVFSASQWMAANLFNSGVADHGGLTGLTDDDHTQYLLADATRASTGDQELKGLNFTDAVELTISSGAVTRTGSWHLIDTESDAATDNLATINGGANGDVLIIKPANDARTIVVQHGIGNIVCTGNTDYILDDVDDTCYLIHDGTNWNATFRVKSATQVEQETANTGAPFVAPSVQQYHPSAAKCWCHVSVSGGTPSLDADYNIDSITDSGVGDFLVVITTDFSSADYSPFAFGGLSGSRILCDGSALASVAVGQFGVICSDTAILTDPGYFSAGAFGDQ